MEPGGDPAGLFRGGQVSGEGPDGAIKGSCHCGSVLFRISVPVTELTTCDCSLCRIRNAVMAKVPVEALTVEGGEEYLTLYEWNTRRAKHHFCRRCGIYLFHRKRAAPDHYGVNAFALHDFDPASLPVRATEGASMTLEDPGVRPEWPGPRVAAIRIAQDDLSGDDVRDLVALHLKGMADSSPPGTCFALDVSALTGPDIIFWTARAGDGRVAGMGALKMLGDRHGELKSMRTHPDFLRRGIAALLLDHIIAEARTRGLARLSLETGSGPAFDPALALYARRGFTPGAPFADYQPSAFNQFWHLDLATDAARPSPSGPSAV